MVKFWRDFLVRASALSPDSARPRAQQCEKSCRSPLFQRLEDLKRHEPIASLGFLLRFATFTLLRPRTGAVRLGRKVQNAAIFRGFSAVFGLEKLF
jgi:hypothetical protein